MRKIQFTLALLLLLCGKISTAQSYLGGASYGGTGWDDVKAMALCSDSSIVAAGMIMDVATFSTTTVASTGYQDGLIAKYSNNGTVQWVRTIAGASEQDWVTGIKIDNSDNVYVTGYFQSSSIYFTPTDSLVKSSLSFRNVFVAKYNSAGTFMWAKAIHGGNTNAFISPGSIALDNANNVIVSGQYNKTVSSSTITLANAAQANIFMFKYDNNGNIIWGKHGQSMAQCWFADMACDASNNIYCTGKISRKITFGSLTSNDVFGDQLILAKFDASGIVQWMQLYGDSVSASTSDNNFDCGISIKLDASNNIFIGGSILDSSYVTQAPITFVKLQSAMVAKYSNSGSLIWMKNFGLNEKCVINAIDLDAQGDVYAIGNYFKNCTVGTTTLPFDTNISAFVAKLSGNNGAVVFAHKNGNNANESNGMGIKVNPLSGTIYTCGNYKQQITFTNTSTSLGGWDMYANSIYNVVSPSGVAGQHKANIKLYPNPCTDKLYINGLQNNTAVLITVINSLGQPVFNTVLDANNALPISQLQKGIYTLKITMGNTIYNTAQFVKY
jgi:hypothetical protein